MAIATDIADAVVAEVASGTFSRPFTVKRMLLPQHELPELANLHVTVVPRGVEISGASRTMCQHDVRIDIGIQQRVGSDLDVDAAALMGLVDEIADFLKRRPLAAAPYAAWIKAANEPLYVPEHLADKRLFTSILTLTYRVLR